LPLPEHISADAIIDHIHPEKDVDGFHPYNVGRLALRNPLLRPCTPHGIMTLLKSTGEDIRGMDAVIVGASNIVGRPMSLELLIAGCTVTVCHRFTRSVEEHVKRADIVIVAVSKLDIVKGEWNKPGAIVSDVGMKRNTEGKLVGDVEFDVAKTHASGITDRTRAWWANDSGNINEKHPLCGRTFSQRLMLYYVSAFKTQQ